MAGLVMFPLPHLLKDIRQCEGHRCALHKLSLGMFVGLCVTLEQTMQQTILYSLLACMPVIVAQVWM
jgi:hypothetical protein